MNKIAAKILSPYYEKLERKINSVVDEKIDMVKDNMEINELKNEIAVLNQNVKDLHAKNFELLSRSENMRNNIFFDINKVPYIKNSTIRIMFLFQVASFWPSWESVYNEIKKNKNFHVKICLLNEKNKEPSQMRSAKKFLVENKIEFELYSEEVLAEFNPHIIFMQTPYDNWHRSSVNDSTYFLKKGIRLIYIPYGIEISCADESIKLQYDNDFIRNMWKVYTLSSNIKNEYIKYSNTIRNSVNAFGHPKFDGIYNRSCLTNNDYKKIYKDKKIILLKIHFKRELYIENNRKEVVTPDVNIYIKFLKECSQYKNCIIMFMAHPKFYDGMEEKLELEIKNLIKKSDNIIEYDSDDYREGLYAADMIISDRSAVLIEAGALEKPVLFMYNKKYKEPFTDSLTPLIESYYEGISTKDIHKFIKNVLEGTDSLYKKRQQAFRKVVPYYDGKCGERIVSDIITTINMEAE